MTFVSIIYLDVWMLVDGGSQKPMASTLMPIPRHYSILKRSMCEKVIWRPKMVLLCFGVFESYGFVESKVVFRSLQNTGVEELVSYVWVKTHQPKLQFVGPRWVEKG